jgi:hypothetical protein
MTMLDRLRTACLVVFLTTSMAAQSATLVNQPPDLVTGDNMSQNVVAESFSLADTFDLTGLRFWALLGTPADYSGSVYWALHSRVGNSLGAVLASGTSAAAAVATGNSFFGVYDEYQLDVGLAFQLTAGDYWLALHNGPLANDGFTDMYWESSSASDGVTGLFNALGDAPDLGWLDTGNEHAFLLSGRLVNNNTVPLPASLSLALLGLFISNSLRRSDRASRQTSLD